MAKKKLSLRILAVLLSVMMLVGLLPAGALAAGSGTPGFTWEKVPNDPARVRSLRKPAAVETAAPLYKDSDVVRVSVVLEDASTIDAGFSTENIASDRSARIYRENLKDKQARMTEIISADALAGQKLDVVWNLTLAANIISANVEYGRIEAIKAVKGVRDVILETRYEPAVVSRDADDPNMAVASDMVGGVQAWENGYTGAGSRVAIIDTGLDIDHQLFDGAALEYAVEDADVELMTADEASAVWDQLNASAFIGDAAGTYLNAKVPFAVNYIDRNLDITHINDGQGEHGSHVAGIAAGNRYIPGEGGAFEESLDAVFTQGEAPDAQLMVMKVFGKGGGAYDSDYMAAIEDAILLGADSVNLSLGSAAAGFVTSDGYQDVMDSLVGSDTVVSISMGNAGGWADESLFGYNYSDKHNFSTGGSPGSFTNALTVASVDNDGIIGGYVTVGGENIYYNETSGYGNEPMTTIGGTYEYVYVDGPGVEDNDYDDSMNAFASLGEKVVAGKIAVCNRGTSSFFAKANAAVDEGAVAVIIVNNQPGTINMNLTGYEHTAPAVSVTQAAGEYFKQGEPSKVAVGEKEYDVYTGTITVADSIGSQAYHSDIYTMSDFSSWGVPGDLSLKPEITAPGGSIRSVWGKNNGASSPTSIDNQYELMSGTSMAAPQVAGLAAVLAQYIREEGLVEKTGLTQRALINSLLMSTATPLMEDQTTLDENGKEIPKEGYYSVMKQGAGLADVDAATNAKAYILMDENATPSCEDGKIKVELGDDPDREGEYTFSFTLNNLTDKAMEYEFEGKFFTQDVFEDSGTRFFDTWTIEVPATVTFETGDVIYVPKEIVGLDFNGDGVFDAKDAVAILELNVNGTPLVDDTGADFNEDGVIDTYDAYLALKYVSTAEAELPVEGSMRVTVTVKFELPDYLDVNGNYVEGYIFVTEKDAEDGAVGVQHSIPVLGYYGSWTEFNSSDYGSFWGYMDETEALPPMLYNVVLENGENADALYMNAFTMIPAGETDPYILGGNPLTGVEEQDGLYHPERNAFNSENGDMLAGYQYARIRNAAGIRFQTLAEDGSVLDEYESVGQFYGSYYYTNQGYWVLSSPVADGYGYAPSGAEELSKITVTHTVAPEYYLDGGSIDWDSVHENSTDKIELTIDNTAPEIANMIAGYDYDAKTSGIMFDVSDNFYIAGFNVYNEEGWLSGGEPILTVGADLEAELGENGETRHVVISDEDIDTTAEGNQHLMIEVVDYASNMSTYKLNLNAKEELEDPDISVAIWHEGKELTEDDEVLIVNKGSAQLTAVVSPWGLEDESVTWAVAETYPEDSDVVTVDENGLVTSVSNEEAWAIVTATSNADKTKSAACVVHVVIVEKDLNGIIWDENGEVWFSAFNAATIPAYTKLNAENMRKELTGAAYDADGTLYAVTLDTENFVSDLYTIDEGTYEPTLVGSSEIAYMDICQAPSLSNNLLGVYGTYVVIIDKASGDYIGAFDMKSYTGGKNLVGIAYEELYEHPAYGDTDWVWLLDEGGNLYNTGFLPYGTSFSRFNVSSIGQIADPVDLDYWQSLYYDGVSLYWSRFNYSDNKVELVVVNDVYNDGSVYSLGTFADSVWPVGGLYEQGINPFFGPIGGQEGDEGNGTGIALNAFNAAPEVDPREEAKLSAVVEAEAAATVEPIALPAMNGAARNGGLNSADVSAKDEAAPAVKKFISSDPYVLKVKAENPENNGLVTVEYDAEVLTLVSAESSITYNVINSEEEGKVVIGFATLTAVEKNGTVATLTFSPKKAGYTDAVVTTGQVVDTETEEPVGTSEQIIRLGKIEQPEDPTQPDPAKPEEPVKPEPTKPDPQLPIILPPISVLPVPSIKDQRPTREPVLPGTVVDPTPEKPAIPAVINDLPFVDVNVGDSFYDDVKFVYENGIMNGISATEFAPDSTLTRAMVVTILYRTEGEPEVEFKGTFTDVEAGTWYSEAVEWAAANGIVKGYGNGKFGPTDAVTLEQLAAILNRYATFKSYVIAGGSEINGEVSEWAIANVNWAVGNDILAPADNYTVPALRSEVATAIHAFCVNVAK